MLTYRLLRRVSHADVDFLGELKVSAMLGLLEQAAVEASTSAGFDAAWYTGEGRIWIIRRTRLERLVPVGGTETVEVETEVIDFRRARSLRRYVIRRGATTVASATTDWVYCDLASGRPVSIPEFMRRALSETSAEATLPRADSLPAGGDGAAVDLSVSVQPSHLDHVTHVNNAVYASFLEDGAFALFAARGWPLERMLAAGGALRPRWLDAEYRLDALAGDSLIVQSWVAGEWREVGSEPPPGASLVQAIYRADGRELLRARSDWVWRRRPAVVGGVPEP